ncbi:hypothetical protein Anapl_17422 [Anas platyrhynchos]|uniref:Uncharacterized protein n=1 Tax=Anas platyrhynchos TaxID=8839 RepID=R0KVW6_ANAPL|nr:hypothetical protein Anapl_17422 [Anas platyrhynchos]
MIREGNTFLKEGPSNFCQSCSPYHPTPGPSHVPEPAQGKVVRAEPNIPSQTRRRHCRTVLPANPIDRSHPEERLCPTCVMAADREVQMSSCPAALPLRVFQRRTTYCKHLLLPALISSRFILPEDRCSSITGAFICTCLKKRHAIASRVHQGRPATGWLSLAQPYMPGEHLFEVEAGKKKTNETGSGPGLLLAGPYLLSHAALLPPTAVVVGHLNHSAHRPSSPPGSPEPFIVTWLWNQEPCNVSWSQEHSWQTRQKLLHAALPAQLNPCSSAVDSRITEPANHPYYTLNETVVFQLPAPQAVAARKHWGSTEGEEADGREGLRGDPYLGLDYVEAGPQEGTCEVQQWLREQGKNEVNRRKLTGNWEHAEQCTKGTSCTCGISKCNASSFELTAGTEEWYHAFMTQHTKTNLSTRHATCSHELCYPPRSYPPVHTRSHTPLEGQVKAVRDVETES